MDLLDWHRGRLSSRRLAILVKHMPQDSAVCRERDGEAAEWSVTDYLLAALVDHMAAANWMFASVHSDEDSDPPEQPVPVPRPGDRERQEDAEQSPPREAGITDPAELGRFFS